MRGDPYGEGWIIKVKLLTARPPMKHTSSLVPWLLRDPITKECWRFAPALCKSTLFRTEAYSSHP